MLAISIITVHQKSSHTDFILVTPFPCSCKHAENQNYKQTLDSYINYHTIHSPDQTKYGASTEGKINKTQTAW